MTAISPATRATARRLRRDMTPQERRLWRHLRELNRMIGTRFRRQAPVGPYIADFADYGRRLVIEVDGGQHGGARDAVRDGWLKGQGFEVLRVWNFEVERNIEGVMQVVLDAVERAVPAEAPPPHPSPTRGEGGALYPSGVRMAGRRASPPPRGEGMGERGTERWGEVP